MLKTDTAERSGVLGQSAAFALSLAGGFLLSETQLAGAASFANISLTAAAELQYSAAILAGSIIRYIISGGVAENMVSVSAMIICVIFKLFFENRSEAKYCGYTAAIAVFVSGAAVSAIIGEVIYKLIFYAVYGAAAGFTAYSAAVVASVLRERFIIDLSPPKSCAYAIVYTIFTASLCSVEISYINPGIILGSAVTLTAAYHYRCTGGILCGALTVCGAFLSSSSCGMSIILLPAAGFLTGYLQRQKAGTAAAFFSAACFVCAVFSGAESLMNMLNILAGTAVFLLVSPKISDKWILSVRDSEALTGIIGSRMEFLASSIRTIRTESGKIYEILAKSTENSVKYELGTSEACVHCPKRLGCWYNSGSLTRRGFEKLDKLHEITEENFPCELSDCIRKDELTESFEKRRRERMTARLLELRFSDTQRLLFEQIKITEELIQAAGERAEVRYSEPVSRQIREKLEKFSFSPRNVIAYYNSRSRLLVELYFSYSESPKNCVRICDLVADELKISLDYAEPVSSGKDVRIRLYERTEYSLEAYGASVCAENSSETGDTSAVFNDGTGSCYVIISDGMGSGRSAALESRMVVSMFRRLISSGVNYSSAIKLINSIMLAKSTDEAFATLDAVKIDLDTCELTVIKSGASATLIRHHGQVMKITSPTFPIGIVEESEHFSRNYDFEENDIIIMFSDGISEGEYQFIKELLLQNESIKYIVDEICAKADVFNPAANSDDITVIGIKVTKNHETV